MIFISNHAFAGQLNCHTHLRALLAFRSLLWAYLRLQGVYLLRTMLATINTYNQHTECALCLARLKCGVVWCNQP
jgi:hypothetical protein